VLLSGSDINGDKIPDIILANYKFPSSSTVYVIYGTKKGYGSGIDVGTMTSSQGFRILGVQLLKNDNLGFLSSGGDVDGDGISDIVIGASWTNFAQGAVYVIYGRKGGYTDFDVSAVTSQKGFKITGNGGYFGVAVDSKADFNGDGIADIFVGASQFSAASNFGAGYVIYGQKARGSDFTVSTMPSTRGFTIASSTNGFVGVGVASAGDFNGDKIDDLVITAPAELSDKGNAYAASSNTGAVFIIYGKAGGDPGDLATSGIPTDRGFLIQGVNSGDLLGGSLASTRDINGDGITEIIIGAQGESGNTGAAYVIFGREDQPSPNIDLSMLAPEQGVKISGSASGDYLSTAVRDLGDINQDGTPDILIGASGLKQAYVVFGNAWNCDTCSGTTCKKCQSGYDYTFNGVCYEECPVSAPYKVGSKCYSGDPTAEEGIPSGLRNIIKKTR